ncbi:hypothetical protein KSS87_004479 [Heliosperma pusillum]|nr:hypothetical protein KSS87_004479 [Heliosperma pusillum]
MEEFGSSGFERIGNAVRKKRTHTFRRRPESQSVSDGPEDLRVGSSDENSGGGSSRRKEISLSQCGSRFPGVSGSEGEKTVKKNKKTDVGLDELYGNTSFDGAEKGRSSEGALAPVSRKNTIRIKGSVEPHKTMALNTKTEEISGPSLDGLEAGTENKVKKVKLKVGGVTRTIDANSSSKSSRALDTMSSRHNTINKGVLDSDNSQRREKRSGLQGIPWKDFSKVGVSLGREEPMVAKGAGKNGSGKQAERADSSRKSRRASKKRATPGLDDDDENDDEIRYLEKLKNARLSSGFVEEDEESSRKHRRLSKFSGKSPQNLEGMSVGKDGKKRSPSMDTDYEEDELISDGEPDSRKRKKARRESVESPLEPKRELTLTTRQRALQSGKDAPGGSAAVEFPNGLPPPTSGKPKEQLTEVEQQVKRAEAAQRRKMQNEKAARESEAEAIRKILGQDSNRRKKEDKKKKRVADLAQEKAADEILRASNSVRLVMGPNGTTVTFPNEMGLPSIFASGPCSLAALIHGLTGKISLLTELPGPIFRPRIHAAWILLCTLQVWVGLGIEATINAGVDGAGFGDGRSMISKLVFFVGLHETMIHWSRTIVRPVVDDTVYGGPREEKWVEKWALAGCFAVLSWLRLRDEVESLVVVVEVKRDMMMKVGLGDFLGLWLYYLTVAIGMTRILKGVMWFCMKFFCRGVVDEQDSDLEVEDKV